MGRSRRRTALRRPVAALDDVVVVEEHEDFVLLLHLAQRRAPGSEDEADTFLRHVQILHVLAAFEVGVHHCRRATTGALLQRDLDAQSREIDLFGKANQLHLGESESEGEGARVRARVEGEDKGEREGEREGEGRVLRVKARVGVRVGWQ